MTGFWLFVTLLFLIFLHLSYVALKEMCEVSNDVREEEDIHDEINSAPDPGFTDFIRV